MKIINRRFSHDYDSVETFEAGIALTGGEVKVVRAGGLKLEGSFVKLRNDGAYLLNAEIPQYQYARSETYDPRRDRKLLLNKKELQRIKTRMEGGGNLTVAPVSCYNKAGYYKLEIALARGRKDIEKRKREKAKEEELHEKREAKEYTKEDY